ncbi:hypothetical protein FH972_022353 [Carpinus fangiana]|uniref:Geranylgeranyl transferase type-2 subunit alpha n=1 Tax=Carpinus fangiana TaxID=176857 RepID=A0A5N6KSJ9_9ROSI|nr:hypothetical protein FH972_022353 [Carpinus fangiana]
MWNYRRKIILALLESEDHTPPVQPNTDLLTRDREFLLPLLKQYPKCYWIWNHRIWLLEQSATHYNNHPVYIRSLWRSELNLVKLMLSRDRRNFHGWDYRRMIVARLRRWEAEQQDDTAVAQDAKKLQISKIPSLLESELSYTEEMIRADLSNFSAWNTRSKLIPSVLDERAASQDQRRAFFEAEIAFLKDGLMLDPPDQSMWKYHQYLMYVLMTAPQESGPASEIWVSFTDADRKQIFAREIADFKELLEDTKDCKWLYQNLLQYSGQYLRLDGGTRMLTTAEMREWLAQLKTLDPLRIGHWNDLGKTLNL